MKTVCLLHKILIPSLCICSLSSLANEDRERAQIELDKARERLAHVETLAESKPGTPEEPLIAEREALALTIASKAFLKFSESDCANQTYHEGAIGGSALGLGITLCLIEKTQARIQELSERYNIDLR